MKEPEIGTRVVITELVNGEGELPLYGVYEGDHLMKDPHKPPQVDFDYGLKLLLRNDSMESRDRMKSFVENMARSAGKDDDAIAAELAEYEEEQKTERQRPIVDRVASILHSLYMNPRIKLDDGRIIWGLECWWMVETQYNAMIAAQKKAQDKKEQDGTEGHASPERGGRTEGSDERSQGDTEGPGDGAEEDRSSAEPGR